MDKLMHLSLQDYKHFEILFSDFVGTNKAEITFRNFREIVVSYRRFNRNVVIGTLDKILNRMSTKNEDDIMINFGDYVDFLELITMEQDKYQNEKDPEIRILFDLLSGGEDLIYKRKIIDILKEFELPLSFDEFFQPIGKKEEIYFSDFCYLFKASNESSEFLLQTFASSFYNLNM